MLFRKLKALLGKAEIQPKIDIYNVDDIIENDIFIEKLRDLTLGPASGMNYELDNFQDIHDKRKVNAKIITAKKNNKIIGWAILSKEESLFGFMSSTPFNPEVDGALFEVYVHHSHRRTGIASLLIKTARKHAGPVSLCVAPWDDGSFAFYNNHKKYKQKRI